MAPDERGRKAEDRGMRDEGRGGRATPGRAGTPERVGGSARGQRLRPAGAARQDEGCSYRIIPRLPDYSPTTRVSVAPQLPPKRGRLGLDRDPQQPQPGG